MLEEETLKHSIASAVREYLWQTLGATPAIIAWAETGRLPFFLQDAFELWEMRLMEQRVLLAIDRRDGGHSIANISDRMRRLRDLTDVPVLYVVESLASYQRRRLIEKKIPFLVPGNQLYLPDLGIDLREYFRKPSTAIEKQFSPATQAVLITLILRKPWQPEWHLGELVSALGYTAMTLSRVVREMEASGVAKRSIRGRSRWLEGPGTAAEAWRLAEPFLRSPVKRRVLIRPLQNWQPDNLRLAGLSALARYSMLADPQAPTYAVSPEQWQASTGKVEILPEPLPGFSEWELWSYSPALVEQCDTVDRLSLALSLESNSDDRVRLAVEEMKESVGW